MSLPPTLSLQDDLLASQISLPKNPCILYSKFYPRLFTSPTKPYEQIEIARQHLLTLNATSSLLDSLLSTIYTGQPSPYIYVFAVSPSDQQTAAAAALQALQFDCMAISDSGSFLLKDVYACSTACSLLESACPDCQSLTSTTFIPRRCLRVVYSSFLEAVRTRLLDDIVKASHSRQFCTSMHKQVRRLQGGFLFDHHPAVATWSSDRKCGYSSRSLVFCHLQVLLGEPLDSSPCLVVHPILTTTPYLPLGQMLPLPSGTPIVLLPYGVPAYYRTAYEGPTAALIEQFNNALNGLGVANWDNGIDRPPGRKGDNGRPMFIIAQITIENKQGVDKGVLIIYPASLCLSLVPSIARSCPPLMRTLDLPTPFQPSPQVQPAVPIQMSSGGYQIGNVLGAGAQLKIPLGRGNTCPSSSEFSRKIRSFTLSSHKDIYRVAEEVGSYVEAVARERERERERLKREREGASSSPHLARAAATTPVPTSSSSSVDAFDQPPETAVFQPAPLLQNNFYPSPPHANVHAVVATDAPTSPGADNSYTTNVTNDTSSMVAVQAAPPCESPNTSHSTYDPFNNIDSTWPQTSETYIGVDLDFDIDMNLGMSEDGRERDVYMDARHSMDFEDVFTDDDFNFFDQPSRIAPLPLTIASNDEPVISQLRANILQDAADNFLLKEEDRSSRLGQPVEASLNWTGSDCLFPDLDTRIPDLSPPGQTPEADSGPSTPGTQLDYEVVIRNADSAPITSPFNPIPFASHHRASDRKYQHGKFSLSSPKREEFIQSATEAEGWRSEYDAVTDPRIAMVRKLVGVKRMRTLPHSVRDISLPSWMREDEYLNSEDNLSEESDGAEANDGDSSNGISRPMTPLSPLLPLGPTLLSTHFEHAFLLCIGTPLRLPDSANASLSNASVPVSVPTPVSPAATLGAGTERYKYLEAVASVVASEAVENNVWSEAWRNTLTVGFRSDVWPSDVKYVSLLLSSVSISKASLKMASLFGTGSSKRLSPLESPLIVVGKGENIIHVLPTALRFWEKLGLSPRGGKKDVTILAIYDNEEGDDQRELQIDSWLETIKAAYTARSYGSLKFLQCSNCPKAGHFLAKYDTSLRKTITCLVSSLAPLEHHYVLLFLVPGSVMAFTSPILRQAIAALKKGLKDHPHLQTIYELVPEYRVFGPLEIPDDQELFINSLCSSIYNRAPSIVKHFASRNLLSGFSVKSRIEEPAFTLARPLPCQVSFAREARSTLDVVDRYTLMHVGYQLSACGKWLAVACIDQRGEAHDVGVRLMRTSGSVDDVEVSDEAYLVQQVWEFAHSFARKGNLEWRIVITKSGTMGEAELDAWTRHLTNGVGHSPLAPLDVFILCAEAQTPWFAVNTWRDRPKPPSPDCAAFSKDTIFTDISSHTYMLCLQKRLPLSLPIHISFYRPLISEVSSDTSIEPEIVSKETPENKQRASHPLTLFPRSSTTLVRVSSSAPSIPISMLDIHLLYASTPYLTPADGLRLLQEITHNFYELSLLARLRWRLDINPILPFHLGAVEVMQTALERGGEMLMDG